MSGTELRECVLLSTYMLCIICGQGCCTAGDAVCVWAAGWGLLCVWIHGQRAAYAACRADVPGMAACNNTRGYFAVK